MTSARPAALPDFSERLHVLRERELCRLPGGARTILHGGAADAWYFRWFDEHYPDAVERHIGVEYFRDRVEGLPENVTWLRRTLGDLGPVDDGSVDLVFGGQVIEHLWPDDVVGFLVEAHRVLRPAGHLVLDSPNRVVSEATGWLHAQHTLEFSVDEIVELVELAGFEIDDVRGILRSYDPGRRRYVGTEDDDELPWDRRAAEGADRPEECFVWWLVARRAERAPDPEAMRGRVHEWFEAFRARRLRRLSSAHPIARDAHGAPRVSAARGPASPLVFGPSVTVDRGSWLVSFALRLEEGGVAPETPIGWIDMTTEAGTVVHARRDLFARDLRADGSWTHVDLPAELDDMLMGAELRAFSYGTVALGAQLRADLRREAEVAQPLAGAPAATAAPPSSAPEPRTVELLAMLRRRTIARLGRAGRRP